MDFFQRVGNLFGGKGFVNDDERRRQEEQARQRAQKAQQTLRPQSTLRQQVVNRQPDLLNVNQNFAQDRKRILVEAERRNAAMKTNPLLQRQQTQQIANDVMSGKIPVFKERNYVSRIPYQDQLTREKFDDALKQGIQGKVYADFGTPYERARKQLGVLGDLSFQAQAEALGETIANTGKTVASASGTVSAALRGDQEGVRAAQKQSLEDFKQIPFIRDILRPLGNTAGAVIAGQKLISEGVDPAVVGQLLDERLGQYGLVSENPSWLNAVNIAAPYAGLAVGASAGTLGGRTGRRLGNAAENAAAQAGSKAAQEASLIREAAQDVANTGQNLVESNPRKPVLNPDDFAPKYDGPTPVETYRPVSINQVQRLAEGDTAAAVSIIRNTGRNLDPVAEQQIAQAMSYADNPAKVKAVLDEFGIPVEDAPVEQVAEAAVAARNQAPIEELQTPVAPVNDTPVASSADISQNGFPSSSLTAKEQQSLQEISEKLGRGEELTKAEEKIYQKAYGVPQEKGAINRALTPEEERPFTRQAVNPALVDNNQGGVKPLTRFGEAGDDLAQVQETLRTEAPQVQKFKTNYIDPIENQIRKLSNESPETAKVFNDYRENTSRAFADTNLANNADIGILNESSGRLSRKQADTMVDIIENFSNPNSRRLQGTPEYEAAVQIRNLLESKLPLMNQVLRQNGLKEIGKVEDYFPRMRQFNATQELGSDLKGILTGAIENNGRYGERALSRSFMKTRELDKASGKLIDPRKALEAYVRQSNELINLAPVIQRGKAIRTVLEDSDQFAIKAKPQLIKLFDTMFNQVTGATIPTKATQRFTRNAINTVSKSQIAGSFNTLLTTVSSPTYGMIANFANTGVGRALKDSADAFFGGAEKLYRLAQRNPQKFAEIDGMRSDLLVNALGTNSAKRDVGSRVVNAGYAFSNLGDLPYRASYLRTRYNRIRKDAPNVPKEQALKQAERDTSFVFGNRQRGERSEFTSNPGSIPQLASQYQIEQIANVLSFTEGVLLNKKTPLGRKFAASIAALGGAYLANEATSAATQGQIQPLPDLTGAVLDAFDQVNRTNEERKQNGQPELTDGEKAGMIMGNAASNFISNLPLGRTALAAASGAADFAGVGQATEEYGLNPRDTNPAQTLPTLGAASNVIKTASDMIPRDGQTAKTNLVEGGLDIGSKFVPFGGQLNRTREGIVDFAQGESRYPADNGQEKGDLKYTVENDLSTPQGVINLATMITSGRMANPGAQEWVKSGFQTQASRDIKNATYDAAQVGALTEEQYSAYERAVENRFKNGLSESDKKLYSIVRNGDELSRNLESGKITQAQADDMKAKINRNYLETGQVHKIDTGYEKEFFGSLPPEAQKFIIERSVASKTKFDDDKKQNDLAGSVLNQAFQGDDAWPTIDRSYLLNTNYDAKSYVTLQKELREAGSDLTSQLEARKKFWSSGVRGGFGEEAKNLYSQSVSTILALANGREVNGKNYSINRKQLDEAVEIDNRLLRAGLINSPKFSNKNREKLGYGPAPQSELEGLGYSVSGSGRSGGSGGTRTYAGDLLTDFGGRANPGFKLNIAGNEQFKSPSLNLGQFANKGSKSGKSSIKIKL